MKKFTIGMIGYGSIGRIHTMAYRALPYHYAFPAAHINIAGVATTRPETAQKAAAEIGCDFWTDNYRELLARPDIEAVHICTPNFSHHELALAAAAAKKHIYCEKPLAATLTEAEEIVEAVARAGVINQIVFNFRFYPAITRAKQLIDEGFLGKIFSFRGRYHRSSYIDPDKPMSWKLRRETAGAGALFDLGAHIMDIVSYLLGDVAAVQALLHTHITERPTAAGAAEREPVTVDDLAMMQLRLADGAPGFVEVSRLATGITNELMIEIFGEHGALRFNSLDPSWLEMYDAREPDQPLGGRRGFKRLEVVQQHAGQKAPDWTQPPGFVRTHAESQYQFLQALERQQLASPSLAHGLDIQRILTAALDSARRQTWVEVG